MLQVEALSVRYGSLTIVDNVSFQLPPASWLMVVGPNGAGKSTLVGALAQNIPYTGRVLFCGGDMKKMRPRDRARAMAVLAQSHYVGYAYTVEEVVRLGRYAYAPGLFSSGDAEGEARVDAALGKVGLAEQRRQSVLTLSGGELQRAFLAQVFAQDPQLLVLDEPANHLDLVYQKQVFGLVRDWIAQTGRTVISVVHDLSLARRYGTLALLMDRGRIVSQGTTASVLTPENLERVYSMDVYAWMRELLGQWGETPPGETP